MSEPGEIEPLDPALAEVWARNLPAIRTRLGALEGAAAAAQAHRAIDPSGEALAAAHQLAGSLGSFGLARGSELARELEDLLTSAEDPLDALEIGQRVEQLREIIEP